MECEASDHPEVRPSTNEDDGSTTTLSDQSLSIISTSDHQPIYIYSTAHPHQTRMISSRAQAYKEPQKPGSFSQCVNPFPFPLSCQNRIKQKCKGRKGVFWSLNHIITIHYSYSHTTLRKKKFNAYSIRIQGARSRSPNSSDSWISSFLV